MLGHFFIRDGICGRTTGGKVAERIFKGIIYLRHGNNRNFIRETYFEGAT